MVEKELDEQLVKRLRHVVADAKSKGHDVYAALGELMNIDSRAEWIDKPPGDTESYGRRVRQLDVSRSFPSVGGVVIKRTHGHSAQEEIDIVVGRVRRHNERYTPENYELLEPHAYPIGPDLVAMSKVNGVRFDHLSYDSGEERNKIVSKMSDAGVDLEQLGELVQRIVKQSEFGIGNLWALGVKDGKLQVIPSLDVE